MEQNRLTDILLKERRTSSSRVFGKAHAKDFITSPTSPGKIHDNFLMMWAASEQDWFDDAVGAITHNTSLIAGRARRKMRWHLLRRPTGKPWSYRKPHRTGVCGVWRKVLERGVRFLQAIERVSHPVICRLPTALFAPFCGPRAMSAPPSWKVTTTLPRNFLGNARCGESGDPVIDGTKAPTTTTRCPP